MLDAFSRNDELSKKGRQHKGVNINIDLYHNDPLRPRHNTMFATARQGLCPLRRKQAESQPNRTMQLNDAIVSATAPSSPESSSGKPLLMFAFYFPPFGQSTGRQRTLSFVRHLPAAGWRPIVITARESAYTATDARTLGEIPPGTEVLRAWGFDIARVTAVAGVYPRWLATPDRWVSWAAGAFCAGVAAARRYRARTLWATFPAPSALLAAIAVHRWTRIPLVVDLRDPLVYESWPTNRWDRAVYAWLERLVVCSASAVILTTPSACSMYRERYRTVPAERFRVIANGIEDDAVGWNGPQAAGSAPITLLHSGLMESPDRDPRAFFAALRLLADRGRLPQQGVHVVLRASGREADYSEAARAHGVDSMVQFAPAVMRREAIAEMAGAAGLLLFQGPECNRQVPAKAYEYLASRRSIIGLTHKEGDTCALLKDEWGVPYIADMNSPEEIAQTLVRFFDDLRTGQAYVPPTSLIARHSRRARAADLAQLLDETVILRA